ncbi:MAG: DNA-binding protein [Ruminococcaceae bacterium]|nr:DNA-binding protein [Oscillospiraceae bacterium]
MEYKRFDDTVVVRIDKGEEITEQLRHVAEREGILLAEVSALGALNDFTVGVFHTDTKEYQANSFQGAFEIVSLTGTVSTMGGAYYAHLHMSAGNERGEVFGGHLNRAVVSATCEMIVRVIDGRVDRKFDEDVGLNLFCFD